MYKSYKERKESYIKWLQEGMPKIYCKCGCNQEIIITKNHKSNSIPDYINGHNRRGIMHSECTLRKMIECKLGENNPMYGKHHTDERNRKVSQLLSGENHWNFGKHHTKKSKDKMSNAKKGKYCGENSPSWKGGKSFEPYCEKFNAKKREEIRNQYNRKCYLCGKDEKDNKYKNGKQCRLSVHHTDFDKKQGCNGKQWKLIPLCIHCHNSKKFIY